MARFDALLAILEPLIKKKTADSRELSVQGPIQCFELRDEVNQLHIRHSGFCSSLVRRLQIVKKNSQIASNGCEKCQKLKLN